MAIQLMRIMRPLGTQTEDAVIFLCERLLIGLYARYWLRE
jgi:hypothetical protein